MNPTKLSFAVDASQIDIKPLLQKEFLELSMRAISSANPNRNNSWFTPESMEKSIDSFKNKPILGYFENGDFVSHNGQWEEDPETDIAYWDTLGKQGERILGLIRSEDDVQIIKDENGVSWICLTCALWTQYSYKQVKRLLKDAKRAKQNGGSAKNISVEVDITDYEMLPNGVMKINAFNLVGITILGSRNGIKVEPGIENAELSVIDVMGKEYFAKQQQAIRLAYEKLDGSKEDIKKEDFSQVETTNKDNIQEEVTNVTKDVETFEQKPEENDPQNENKHCEEDGEKKEDCACNTNLEENPKEDNKEEQPEDKKPEQEECKNCEEDHDEDDEGEEDHDEDDKDEEENPKEQEECKNCEEEKPEDRGQCEEEKLSDNSEGIQHEEDAPEQEPEKCEAEKLGYTLETLYEAYKQVVSEKETLAVKVHEYEKKEFLKDAKTVIDSVELTEEQSKEFYDKCCNDEIKTVDDLKVNIAVAVMFTNKETKVEKTESYSAPVNNPDTQSFSNKAEKSTKKDKWSALRDIINK